MNQITLNVKKNFLSRTFSRCVAEMCPGIVKLEYHFHDNSDEVVITRRVDVTGLDLQQSVETILAVLNRESMRRLEAFLTC